MAQPGVKYWEYEQPQVLNEGDAVIKFYPVHRVVQFFKNINTKTYKGLSKGVVFHLDQLSDEQRQKIAQFITAAFASQQGVPILHVYTRSPG